MRSLDSDPLSDDVSTLTARTVYMCLCVCMCVYCMCVYCMCIYMCVCVCVCNVSICTSQSICSSVLHVTFFLLFFCHFIFLQYVYFLNFVVTITLFLFKNNYHYHCCHHSYLHAYHHHYHYHHYCYNFFYHLIGNI